MSDKNFYKTFEKHHRGPRELIKERISIYLPFVLPLGKIYPQSRVIDIGCGRGEWLELLKENDISAFGIDQDEGMLSSCHSLGLDVVQDNGIEYLQRQADKSAMVISAFHVVEHISFEELQILVKEAQRVLLDGGILILETPNPENIKVATSSFYIDPTHTKPIPHELLSFLPDFFGFKRTKVLRLQEDEELISKESLGLIDVLSQVSPDYSIVAQKFATNETIELLNHAFTQKVGYSLEDLALKFDNRLIRMEKLLQENSATLQGLEHRINEALLLANENSVEYTKIVNSTSWKITRPLRVATRVSKSVLSKSKYELKTFSLKVQARLLRIFGRYYAIAKYKISTKPKLKQFIKKILSWVPALETRLLSASHDSQLIEQELLISEEKMIHFLAIKQRVEDKKNGIDRTVEEEI